MSLVRFFYRCCLCLLFLIMLMGMSAGYAPVDCLTPADSLLLSKADSLYTLAESLCNNEKKYDEASKFSYQALDIRGRLLGERDTSYIDALDLHAFIVQRSTSLDSVVLSIDYHKKLADYFRQENNEGAQFSMYNSIINTSTKVAQYLNDLDRAECQLDTALKYLDYFKPSENKKAKYDEIVKLKAAIYYKRANDNNGADNLQYVISQYEQAAELYKSINDSIDLGYIYSYIGVEYLNRNEYEDALTYFYKALELMELNPSAYESFYPNVLTCCALCNYHLGNYDIAFEYGQKAETENLRFFGPKAPQTANLWFIMSNICEKLLKLNYAQDYLTRIKKFDYDKLMPGLYKVSLGMLVDALKSEGKGVETISYLNELLELSESEEEDRNIRFDLLQTYIVIGDHDWEKKYDEFLQKIENLKSENPLLYMYYTWSKIDNYIKLGIYQKAHDTLDMLELIVKDVTDPALNSKLKYKRACVYSQERRVNETVEILNELINDENIKEENKIGIYELYSETYYNIEKYDLAEQYSRKSVELSEKNDTRYPHKLTFLATILQHNKKYEEADSVRAKVMEIYEDIYGKESIPYLRAQIEREKTPGYGNPYVQKNMLEEFLNKEKEINGEKSDTYAAGLLEASDLFKELGLYKQSIEYAREAADLFLELKGEQDRTYLNALMQNAYNNRFMGDYDQSNIYLQIVLELLNKYHLNSAVDIYGCYGIISDNYAFKSDFGNALHYALLMRQYAKEHLGDDPSREKEAINRIIKFYYQVGNVQQVRRYCSEALEVAKRDNIINGETLMIKMLAELKAKNYEQALKGAQLLKSKNIGFNDVQALTMQYNLAVCYEDAGKIDEAVKIYDRLTAMMSDSIMTNDLRSMLLAANARLEIKSGDRNEGVKLLDKTVAFYDSVYNATDMNYLQHCLDFISFYDELGLKEKRDRLALKLSDNIKRYINESFLTLTANARESLWGLFSEFLMDQFSRYAAENPTPEMLDAAYNNILLGKGLMLNTQLEITEILNDVNDSEVGRLYSDYMRDRRLLENIHKGDSTRFAVNLSELEATIQFEEYELLKHCGEFTSRLNVRWPEIAATLGDGQAAVEIVGYHDSKNSDVTKYSALIIKKDCQYPLILNFDESDFLKVWQNDEQLAAAAIWSPMASALKDCHTVYFSASGDFHFIPIETLPDYEIPGQRINERFNIVRTSSTRLLKQKYDDAQFTQAAVYGGLMYDTDPELLAADASKYSIKQSTREASALSLMADVDSMFTRSALEYLPATLQEAENVDSLLNKNNINSRLYSDLQGTETSLKALSGSDINVLHIATHGFAWSEKEARRMNNLNFLQTDNTFSFVTEDRALSRSGLLFTGAGNVFKGIVPDDGVDDGVLTAREIARLDFKNVDLVVLSACDTGLGDVSTEGVIGLQRGFKKAGVKSMLMSLWKVDDAATQLLMTRFYENLVAGNTRQEALKLAQKYLIEYEDDVQGGHPYSDSKYWASFILLDALN